MTFHHRRGHHRAVSLTSRHPDLRCHRLACFFTSTPSSALGVLAARRDHLFHLQEKFA